MTLITANNIPQNADNQCLPSPPPHPPLCLKSCSDFPSFVARLTAGCSTRLTNSGHCTEPCCRVQSVARPYLVLVPWPSYATQIAEPWPPLSNHTLNTSGKMINFMKVNHLSLTSGKNKTKQTNKQITSISWKLTTSLWSQVKWSPS